MVTVIMQCTTELGGKKAVSSASIGHRGFPVALDDVRVRVPWHDSKRSGWMILQTIPQICRETCPEWLEHVGRSTKYTKSQSQHVTSLFISPFIYRHLSRGS